MMSSKFPVLKGGENLSDIEKRMVKAIVVKDITIGADIDGTLVHAKPGEHKNVPADPALTKLFNDLNIVTDGHAFMLTGRPQEFVNNVFPGRKFLVGTEHGAVLSFVDRDEPFFRVGSPQKMKQFREAFQQAVENTSLADVQIESYKTLTATLGFTHIINPHGQKILSGEAINLMHDLTEVVCRLSSDILNSIGATDVRVVDTVTPINSVVEIIPDGACKAESFQYLRDSGFIREASLNVFSGDGGGDLNVMEKVFNEGGICLGVGPKAPDCSHVVFEKPEHHRAFLAHVLDVVSLESSAVQSAIALKR